MKGGERKLNSDSVASHYFGSRLDNECIRRVTKHSGPDFVVQNHEAGTR